MYSNESLYSGIVINGKSCDSYNSYGSHEGIVIGAIGDSSLENYDFRDPRPNMPNNKLKVDRYFIDRHKDSVMGVNLVDSNGKFVCSYQGEGYGDLVMQNETDLLRKRVYEVKKPKEFNIEKGTKTPRLRAQIGDKHTYYDDAELKKTLPRTVKEIKLKREEHNPELYDKYRGIKHPETGEELTPELVYTNEIDDFNTKEKVQYVEFSDQKTGERFFYVNNYQQSVDEQIINDMTKAQSKNKEKQKANDKEISQNTIVNQQDEQNQTQHNQGVDRR